MEKSRPSLGLYVAAVGGLLISGLSHAEENAEAIPREVKPAAQLDQNVEEVLVTGSHQSFLATDANGATLFDMALDETPFNIGVIKEVLIDDLQYDDLIDAVLLNASVNRTHSHTDNAVQFNIRGFDLATDKLGYLVNGVPVASFDAPVAHISALESIEVIKGTAALYYGAGEPAGVINYNYKKPRAEAEYTIQASVGSYSERRAQLDFTGAFGSENLLYRFTLGWEDSDGVIDYDYSRDLAPTFQLLWSLSKNTQLRAIAEYAKYEGNPLSQDTIYLDGDYVEGPKGQYLGFSTDYEEQEHKALQLHLEHVLSEDLRLKLQAGIADSGREGGNSGYSLPFPITLPGISDTANGLLPRSAFDQSRSAENEYFAAHIEWVRNWGATEHSIVVGGNYSKAEVTNIGYFNSLFNALQQAQAGNPAALFALPPSLNVNNPVTVAYEHARNFGDTPPFYRDIWNYDNLGLNIQDKIDVPSLNLHVLLGLRYSRSGGDSVESIEEDGTVNPVGFDTADQSAWVPRIGVVYDINEQHSVYASYGESFNPPSVGSVNVNGQPITEAEEGEQLEIGWRGKFFDERLSTVLALYDLTKQNIVVPSGVPDISLLSGEQNSKGIELDITGSVTSGWELYFSYAYTNTEIIDAGTTGLGVGDRFAAIPEHSLVAWNRFSLDWTGIEGLSLGYGLDYSSKTFAGALDPVTISSSNVETDGQGLIQNANISYHRALANGKLNLTLGVSNLADRFYVINTNNTIFAKRGEPRTVLFTAAYTFN